LTNEISADKDIYTSEKQYPERENTKRRLKKRSSALKEREKTGKERKKERTIASGKKLRVRG